VGSLKFLDELKRQHSTGFYYWLARDFQGLLGYTKWDNFKSAIEKAKMACNSVGNNAGNHFADIRKMVTIGSGTQWYLWYISSYKRETSTTLP